METKTETTKKPDNWHVQVTIEQLRQAVADYEMILPTEIKDVYETLLSVPDFGLRVAQALQQAVLDSQRGILNRDRVLDAAVIPAFLIGFLAGSGQQEKFKIIA